MMFAPPRFRILPALALGMLAATAGVTPESAQSVRALAPAEIALEPLATGLGPITSIASAGDSRLFLTIQTGAVRIWDGSRLLPAPFVDLSSQISCCGERGLLSISFHPRYAQNGRFFLYSTDPGGNLVIERRTVSASDPNTGDSSGVVLFSIPHPINSNHNGGETAFGPDGKLYIGVGDGGSANDPPCNAQREDVLLGKLLRVDVDSGADAPPYYSIPADNPFVSRAGARPELWAIGLRNPWRFSFDRVTGDLWIGDVGQDRREEVDFAPRSSRGGENYGWKIMQGGLCGAGDGSGCPPGAAACHSSELVLPVFEYGHDLGDCSITGGYLYRGSAIPLLRGTYVYGDYCTGRIWGSGALFAPTARHLTSFGEDSAGELYAATQDGVLYRIVDENPSERPVPILPDRRRSTPRVLDAR